MLYKLSLEMALPMTDVERVYVDDHLWLLCFISYFLIFKKGDKQ